MPTTKKQPEKVQVIKVTTDVYDIHVAVDHYKEEARAGLYVPLIFMEPKKLGGKDVMGYCVCRIPRGSDDQAFISTVQSFAVRNNRKECGIADVDKFDLFVLVQGELIQAVYCNGIDL